MTVVVETLESFTLEAARRVAWGGEDVALGRPVKSAMDAGRARLMRLLDDPDVVIYGVTSGYGQNAKIRLSPEERRAHARRPMGAAAAAWGDPVPERVARAICFARLANLVEGHSGARYEIAAGVAGLLAGPLPPVPARGQGGAGEILSLSHLFGPMARAMELQEKEMLALVNGSPAATGLAADAALAAAARLDLAAEVLAFGFEAFGAPMEHLDPALDALWANPHDAWALARMRALIGPGGGARRPYQAPVSFRIAPRVLGEAHRAAAALGEVAAQSLRAVTDNPVILAGPDRACSTGGYHNIQAAAAMDAVTAASANLIVIAERMLAKLLDPAVSLLPPPGPDGPYLGCLGMMAVGLGEEARMLAAPTLLPGSESGGYGQNDVASPVFLAWSKQDRAGLLLEQALAGLAIVALDGYARAGRQVPAPMQGLAALSREAAPPAALHVPGPPAGALAERFRARVLSA